MELARVRTTFEFLSEESPSPLHDWAALFESMLESGVGPCLKIKIDLKSHLIPPPNRTQFIGLMNLTPICRYIIGIEERSREFHGWSQA